VQPPTKRAAAIGISNLLANTASLFANCFWLDQYEPTFQVSWGILLAFQVLELACILFLRYNLKRSNKRFDYLSSRISANNTADLSQLDPIEQNAIVDGIRYTT
jgi:hypothetical protein